MTLAHRAMDVCLWLVAVLWLCEFLAKHPGPMKRNRRLPPPDVACERTGKFEVQMCSLTKRQAG